MSNSDVEGSEVPFRVLIGTLGHDCHVHGIQLLSHTLRGAGFEVIYLGGMVEHEEWVASAVEEQPDAILVSSVYGQAETDVKGFKALLDEAGVHSLLYIGGNLVIGGHTPEEEVEAIFLAEGFDRVWGPRTDPSDVIRVLRADLVERRNQSTAAAN